MHFDPALRDFLGGKPDDSGMRFPKDKTGAGRSIDVIVNGMAVGRPAERSLSCLYN